MLALFDDVSKSMSHLYTPTYINLYLPFYPISSKYMSMKLRFDMSILKMYEILDIFA